MKKVKMKKFLKYVFTLIKVEKSIKSCWAPLFPPPVLSETLDIDLEIQDLVGQDQVLVLVSTKFQIQDKSWYWSHFKMNINRGLGLEMKTKLK